jgi:hypothetical protein
VDTTGALSGKKVVAISSGIFFNLALCSDGTMVAWGDNSSGKLGDGTTTARLAPVSVNTLGALAGKRVRAISTGTSHCLALCTDGTLVTWGFNSYGQLGDGTFTSRSTPVVINSSGILAGKTVTAISSHGVHSIALCSDGTIASFGINNTGQLGDNTTINRNIPVAVDTTGILSNKFVTAVTAGFRHNLALCSEGTLVAFGYNFDGQIGNNTSTFAEKPVLTNTSSLAANERFTTIFSGFDTSFALVAAPPKGGEIAVFNGANTAAPEERQSGVGRFVFPNTLAGQSSPPQSFTIQNTGEFPLTNLSVSVTGVNAAEFVISPLQTTMLLTNTSTTFTVTYSPTAAATRTAMLEISSNDSNENPFLIHLTGRDVNSAPIANPNTIQRSGTKSIKVSITGLLLDDSDPDNDAISLSSVQAATPVGATVTRDANWVYYTPPIDSYDPGSFSYTIDDGFGGSSTAIVTVAIKPSDNTQAANQTKLISEPTAFGDQIRVTFQGIPGRTYTIEATNSLTPPNWVPIGTALANSLGAYQFVDPPPLPPSRFYRSVYP